MRRRPSAGVVKLLVFGVPFYRLPVTRAAIWLATDHRFNPYGEVLRETLHNLALYWHPTRGSTVR